MPLKFLPNEKAKYNPLAVSTIPFQICQGPDNYPPRLRAMAKYLFGEYFYKL
jgi:hypothetical protein